MNSSYRTLWNEALGAWVAVSELGRRGGKKSRGGKVAAGGVVAASLLLATFGAHAQSLYWDVNGSTAGAGGTDLTGTWSSTATNWNTLANGTGATVGWTVPATTAVFSANSGGQATGGYAVTVDPAGVTAQGISLNGGTASSHNVTFSGGTVTLTGPVLVNPFAIAIFNSVIAGSAGLVKNGTGALILTGNNTYTGTTTINGGILSIGASTTGSVTGNVVNNSGTLAFNRSNAYTFAGVISGSGGFIQQGTGTLTLTGLNTYTGNTTVNAGSLQGTGSSVQGGIVNNANVTLTGGTYTGTMSGSGSLTITAPGSQVGLTGTNSFAGGTLISANSSLIGPTSSLPGNIVHNGTDLTFNNASGTYAGIISGTGQVSIATGSTITFTGANTYTGATALNASTLQVGNGGTTGNIAGSVLNNGTLIFNRGNASSFAGNISGTGSLTQAGGGTLVMTGTASHTGGTTVSAGTLQIGNGGTSGSLAGAVTDNGALVFNRSDVSSFTGNVNGTGSLTQAGTGTLVMSGAATQTGGTTISAGTLQLGNGGTTGSVAGDITDNGTLAFNRSDTVSLANVVSGAGALTQAGTGTLVLTGANTYTGSTLVSAGTLQLGNGGTTGSIVGNVVDNGALVFNRSDAVDFTNVISGTGSVVKQGAAALVLTGDNTYSGLTNIAAGTLRVGNGGTSGRIAGDVIDNGALIFDRSDASSFAGNVGGTGSLTQAGAGTLVMTGAAAHTGGTTIAAGTLQIGAGGTSGSLAGNVVDSGALVFNRSDASTFAGNVSGAGSLTQAGTGTTVLTGAATHTGGTTISAGTLQVGNGGTTGSIVGDVTDNGTLAFNHNDGVTFANVVSGTGTLTQAGTGTLVLTGAHTYGGGTLVSAGTLQLGNGGAAGSIVGDVTDNGALVFNRSDVSTFPGNVAGTGSLTQAGSGTTVLTGAATHTGGTVVSAGTLQIGNGGTTGSIAGNVFDNGTLVFNRGDASTFAGTLSGTGNVVKQGAGALDLTAANTYAGGTTVAAGTLRATNTAGSATGSGAVAVASGATLGGTGSIAGAVTVANGGHLAPGMSPGTLTLGSLILNPSSNLDFELGAANSVGNPLNDLINVNGNVVLDGILNITQSAGGTFGPGTYRLINYTGSLTNNTLDVGAAPVPAAQLSVQTSTANQVNVVNNGGLTIASWDGGNGADFFNGAVNGGSGAWRLGGTTPSWTDPNGVVNGSWTQDAFALFQGAPGTVTVDNSGGAVSFTGAQFGVGGYVVDGTALTTNNANTTIRVGDATPAGATMQATVAAPIVGTGRIIKDDLGTLVLTGANSYSGGTLINNGTLQIGNGGIAGSIAGNVTDNGTLAFNRSDAVSFAGAIGGTGGVVQQGGGTLTLSGANTYTGGTTVSAGRLQGRGGSIQGNIVNNAAVTLTDGTYAGNMSGTGSLTATSSTLGNITLSGTNSYSGGTLVSAGSVLVGTVGSLQGNIVDNGILAFELTSGTYAGNISGTGGVSIQSDSSVTWTGVNSYSGGTTVLGNLTGTTSSLPGNISYIGTLTFDQPADGTFAGDLVSILGGTLIKANGNSLTLTSDSGTSNVGPVFVNAGTLQIGNGGTTGLLHATNVQNDAALRFNRSNASTFTGDVSGTGSVTQAGTGTLTLTGAATHTGGTVVSAGTLQIGNGGTTGSVAGNITDNGTLAFNRGDAVNVAGVISGTGNVVQQGAGALALSAANTYAGGTTVAAGTLRATNTAGSATGSGAVAVASGATLGGTGSIAGAVTVANGGHLAPGMSPGTLTLGSLILNPSSNLDFELGAANSVGNPLNDLINVNGNVVLDGILNITQSAGGTFGPGTYRLINYTGSLTDNTLSIGAAPVPAAQLIVQTAAANQVNLINSGGLAIASWDGANPANFANGAVNGGTGTWRIGGATTSWTDANGVVNGTWTPGAFALFQGAPGTVTVDNGGGAVTFTGAQFGVSGYAVDGAALTTNNANTTIRVGDATPAGAAMQATIAAPIVGTGRVIKDDLGTLVLTGANTYSGGTLIANGTLQLGNGGTTGTVTGAIVDNANLSLNRSGAYVFGNNVSGSGSVTVAGGGSVSFTSANTYTGGTTIDAGSTLTVGIGGGTAGSIVGNVIDNGSLVISRGNDLTLTGNISGSGSLRQNGSYVSAQQDSPGGLTLTGNNTYTGGTIITAGAVQLGNGGTTGSIVGDVAITGPEASLVFNRSDTLAFVGTISGGGFGVTQLGTGTTVLTGNNTYTGGTTLGAGTLQLGNGGTTGSIVGNVSNSGTLAFNRSDTSTFAGVVSGGGRVVQAGAGTTILTGTHTYTGGTTVSAGTLQLGNGGTTGSVVGNVTNNGTLAFNRSDDLAFGATISGNGAVTKLGANTLTFTADNTYTGVTQIQGGTLQLGNGGTTGTIAGDVSGAGTLLINRSNAVTLAGVVSGTAAITKVGANTLTLLGNNTSTGDTTISAGTLRLGNGGTSGSVAGNVINNAALVVERADTVTLPGTISGTGSVTQTGAGTTRLTGANSYSGGTRLLAGTVAVGSNTALGTGTLSMDGGTTLGFTADGLNVANAVLFTGVNDPTIDTGAFSETLSGVISGTGHLTKQGSGALTLSGANTYAGATDVAQGTLRAGAINGFSAASAHTVAAGATLDLAGFSQTIASLTNSGTVSLAGTTPGTLLTVTGPYVGNGGQLRLSTALASGASDRLVLRGANASVSGTTTLQVVNASGLGALTIGNGVEVVSAQNGATTTAQTTKTGFALGGGHIDAGAFEYRLFAGDAAGSGENWYLRSSIPLAEAPPDAAAPAQPGQPGQPGQPTLPGGGAAPTTPASPASVVPLYRVEVPLFAALPSQLRQSDLAMLGNLHQRIGDDDVAGSTANASGTDGRRAWGRVLSTDRKTRQAGTVSPASDGRTTGFQAGTDLLATNGWRAGVYVGQMDGKLGVSGFAQGLQQRIGSNDLRSQYIGGYATWTGESGFYADAVLQAGRHRVDIEPDTSVRSHAKASSLTASIEVGRAFALDAAGSWKIEPQLQLIHQHVGFDDAQIGNAQVQNRSSDSWTGRAGFRIKGEMTTGMGVVQPYARVNVSRSSGGNDVARFIGGAGATDISTARGGTTVEAAGGFSLALGGATTLYGELGKVFDAGGRERQRSTINGSLGVRVRW